MPFATVAQGIDDRGSPASGVVVIPGDASKRIDLVSNQEPVVVLYMPWVTERVDERRTALHHVKRKVVIVEPAVAPCVRAPTNRRRPVILVVEGEAVAVSVLYQPMI
jgi:hypothetical protein